MDQLELSIDELLLDQENPRLRSVNSQPDALEAIVHLNETHFRNMMLSIKENGLDPGDSFYVIEGDDGDYIALDGNRRLAAIMVLNNPNLLEGTNIADVTKKSLARVATGFDRKKVEPIRCVLFDRRDDAKEWIKRRHVGFAEGEGRVDWKSIEIQRFSGDRSVLDIIDFVGRNADHTAEEWESTKSVIESNKSSNLARLLESKVGRQHLGITLTKTADGTVPMLAADPKWAVKVLQRVIGDVRDGVVDSRRLNKASEIANYFKGLPKPLQPQKRKAPAPRPFKDIEINGEKAKPEGKKTTKEKTKKGPSPRVTLAEKKHAFKAPDETKGQRLLHEAAHLDANKFTISAAFVLRGFVELAVNDYVKAQGLATTATTAKGTRDLTLNEKTENVVQHIVANKLATKNDMQLFRSRIITSSSEISITCLHLFAHHKFSIPTADLLRRGWDCSIPLFIATYGAV